MSARHGREGNLRQRPPGQPKRRHRSSRASRTSPTKAGWFQADQEISCPSLNQLPVFADSIETGAPLDIACAIRQKN